MANIDKYNEKLTCKGMTSLVTRKRSRWKSETMSRKEEEEEHWERYVAKLWKSCAHTIFKLIFPKNCAFDNSKPNYKDLCSSSTRKAVRRLQI